MHPTFDCKPSGVRADPEDPGRPGDNPGEAPAQPPCAVQRPLEWDGKQFPRIRGMIDPLGGSPRTPKPSAPRLSTRTDHDGGRVPVR